MPDEGFPRLVNESRVALQVFTAGNLRRILWLSRLVREKDQFDRFLIATDTPTGSGIMPPRNVNRGSSAGENRENVSTIVSTRSFWPVAS
jgi:hypothetical protein